MKIRITGRTIPQAEDGFETTSQTTCPPGYIYVNEIVGCVKNQNAQLNPTGSFKVDRYQQGIGPRLGNYVKNTVGSWFSNTESTGSKSRSFLDPTGISNLPFLNKSFDEFYNDPTALNALDLGFESLGAIPVFGKGSKMVKESVKRVPWKKMTAAEKAARIVKAPVRAAKKIAKGTGTFVTSPTRLLDKTYSRLGIPSSISGNPLGTFNRSMRFWDLSSPMWYPPFQGGVEAGVNKVYPIVDQYLYPEDYENIPKKDVGGTTTEECRPGYAKDPMTLKCVPTMMSPQQASEIDPWGSWSNSNSINATPAPLPQQVKIDPYGNQTVTPGVDIGNPRLYETDPQQNPQTNLYALKGKCQPGYYKDKSGNCVPNVKKNFAKDLSPYFDMAIGAVRSAADFFNDKKNQRDWNTQFRQNILPDNRYVARQADKGYVRTNEGDWVGAGYKTQNFGEFGGSMLKDSNMDKIKIRIIGEPNKMAYGGQLGYGFDLGQRNTYTAMPKGKTQTVSSQMPEVPREEANIEAEKGETVYADVDGDGVEEHMNIGGKRHTEGGTPLNVPEGSFVFSDTKDMRIKDEEILAKFGLSPKKGGYTPAEIAKKYDINKYKAYIEDPNSDSITKNTAMLMIKSYQKKLAELALIQEEMKGFPQGIPEMCRGIIPDETLNQIEEQLAARQPKDPSNPEDREVIGKVQEMAEQSGLPIPTASDLNMEEIPEEEMMYGGDYEYGGDLEYFEDDEVLESEYGGEPIKMQIAGQVPSGQIKWLSPELENAITTINKQTGQKVIVSPRMQQGDIYIPPIQNKQKTGLYGDVTINEIEEFKKRHEWYFKDRPDWSFSNPSDVMDFQTQYDQEFAKKNNFQYFTGNNKFNKKDGLFGEYTFNAPGLEIASPDTSTPDYKVGYKCTGRDAADKPQIQESSYKDIAARTADGAYASPQEAAKNQCPPTNKTQPNTLDIKGETSQPPFGYLTPDLVGIGVAAGARVRKYLPYIAETAYEPGRYLPEDWKAKASQLKSLSEQMGKQMADYMPGQNLQASLSNLYGQNAEALIGAIADVDARNVRGVNPFNQAEIDRKDKFNLVRAANATERWKGNVIANQQYDNALNEKRENIYDRYQNAWTNRMSLGLVNTTNKYYYTDPFTGRTIFKGGYGPQNLGASSSGMADWNSIGQDYTKAITALPGITPSDYLRAIGKLGSNSKESKYGGNTFRNKKKNAKLLAEALFGGHTLPF